MTTRRARSMSEKESNLSNADRRFRDELEKEIRAKKIARSKALLRESGLESTVKRMTFDTFIPSQEWQARAKKIAMRFAINPSGWLIACGQSGSGKTHLCTAAAGALIERGMEVKYLLWRQEYYKLTSFDAEDYRDELRRCECLYIDDLFKGSDIAKQVAIAFDILDARYRERKLTIISTECMLDEIKAADEALYGRIREMCAGNIIGIKKEDGRNWRTEQQKQG